MKSSSIIYLCLLFSLTLCTLFIQTSATIHIFLVAGQSNSVGENSQGSIPSDTTSNNLLQLSCCTNNNTEPVKSYDECTLVIAQDPLLHYCPPHHIGWAMSFLRSFNATIPEGDIVIVVPSGLDGTGFSDDQHTWMPPDGPGFSAAVAKVQQAYKLAVAIDPDTVFEALLWHQGESDDGDNVHGKYLTIDEYTQDFSLLANEFRNTTLFPFTSPKLPIVVGQLLPQWVFNTTLPKRLQVGRALENMPTSLPYVGFANSEGLTGDPVYRSGTTNQIIHFDAPSARILGRRYFAQFAQLKHQLEMEKVKEN
jgi:hypothetical protein